MSKYREPEDFLDEDQEENDLSTMTGCIWEAIKIISRFIPELSEESPDAAIAMAEHYSAVCNGLNAAVHSLEFYEAYLEMLKQKYPDIETEISTAWLDMQKAHINDMLNLDGLPEDDIEIEVEDDVSGD